MRVFGDRHSGNCQKVVFLCDHLGIAYDWREVDVAGGETRTAAFLALNPAGQVPVVQFDDGRTLAQSNAILAHLAEGSALMPAAGFGRAKVFEWLFWEQYSHEPYIAVCRYALVYEGKPAAAREPWRVARGEAALDLMERQLCGRSWLADNAFTIADVALVAYTRLAPEGGFDLGARDNVRAWVDRCAEMLQRRAT
jgi:glutathione S-transferase